MSVAAKKSILKPMRTTNSITHFTLLHHRATAMPVVVVVGRGVSRVITDASQYALRGYSHSARRKLVKWFARWLAQQTGDTEALINRPTSESRTEIESFLRQHGCLFARMKGPAHRDGMIKVTRKGQDTTEISIFLNAMLDFYEWLIDHGLRSDTNPLMVDLYKKQEIAERRKLDARRERGRTFFTFRGLRYEIHSGKAYRPKMQDPSQVRDAILVAGREMGWPQEVDLALSVMADSGCRIGELPLLTAWDWWEASRFNEGISAPNKSSGGERVKTLLVTEETARRLVDAFETRIDGYSSAKSMHMLRKWAEKWDAEARLKKVLLFPKPDGKAMSEWSLRQTYFNRAARRSNYQVPQLDGTAKRPTPHVFRHARIDEEIRKLDALYPDLDDFAAALIDFAHDMHFGPENIFRYAAGRLHLRRMRIRKEIMKINVEDVADAIARKVGDSKAKQIVEGMRKW